MTAKSYKDSHPIEHDADLERWIYSDTKEPVELACKCQGCGNLYKIDLVIDDGLWEIIKPEGKPKGAGLLCGSCIMDRLEKVLEYAVLELIKR